MTKRELQDIRSRLDKTQRDMARLLGVSLKAVESYEQGWRNIPTHVERLAYYLLFKLHSGALSKTDTCWNRKKCPPLVRRTCVAWIADEGYFCWFLTGKGCVSGKKRAGKSAAGCSTCDFFRANLEIVKRGKRIPRAADQNNPSTEK